MSLSWRAAEGVTAVLDVRMVVEVSGGPVRGTSAGLEAGGEAGTAILFRTRCQPAPILPHQTLTSPAPWRRDPHA